MREPTATYRFQLNANFTLREAAGLVPYLEALGITDAYLSPVLQAQPGSTHGYDVTDPAAVRHEIGGEAALRTLTKRLQTAGMGLLLDIVPNHMAATPRNRWWHDVLEHGADSPFADWFDFSWSTAGDHVPLGLPVLADDLSGAIERGEIRLAANESGLALLYFDQRLPLAPATYPAALGIDRDSRVDERTGQADAAPPAARAVLEELAALSVAPTPTAAGDVERRARAIEARDRFVRLHAESAETGAWIEQRLAAVNAEGSASRSSHLERLLRLQPYRLLGWRSALREVTYRRFFDITQLVGVRVELPAVFEATHALVRQWMREGIVTGLRIDHIDGLLDPEQYLERLRGIGPVYTIVEKILAADESLPPRWETEGTTGYDFLTVLNGWFIEPDGMRRLGQVYEDATGVTQPFTEIVYRSKLLVIEVLFGGELAALARELEALARQLGAREHTAESLRAAIREVTACLSVYRTYITSRGSSAEDRARIEAAVAQARQSGADTAPHALDLLRQVLLLDHPRLSVRLTTEALRFVLHWQQLTGPVMAKGFEDTALYNYFPLLSANDVGGEPAHAAVSTERLHEFLSERARVAPSTLNATSTHDTKRSEDVRSRLNVLSEFPDEWQALLHAWSRAADEHAADGSARPTANDDVLLLQTLIGSWPLAGEPDAQYAERVLGYLIKAAREAKANTNWHDPAESYEGALRERVHVLLEKRPNHPLREAIRDLAMRIAYPGALNALTQVVLKATAPGVPDFYAGTELWFFALVDPDNRRPVDYELRETSLRELSTLVADPTTEPVAALLRSWTDGRIKLFITATALHHRRDRAQLFGTGDYLPLEVTGPRGHHVCAFARQHDDTWSVTVAARWLASAVQSVGRMPAADFWHATRLRLPARAPRRWRSALTGEQLTVDPYGEFAAEQILSVLPAAVLYPAT